jgi:hypothetical protein
MEAIMQIQRGMATLQSEAPTLFAGWDQTLIY